MKIFGCLARKTTGERQHRYANLIHKRYDSMKFQSQDNTRNYTFFFRPHKFIWVALCCFGRLFLLLFFVFTFLHKMKLNSCCRRGENNGILTNKNKKTQRKRAKII